MAERADSRIWGHRFAFLALAFLILAAQLVPLNFRPSGFAGPDVLLAATLVWVIRKPAFLPVLAVAAVYLLADLILLRPPGLWAALVVLLTEVLRRQHRELRNLPLLAEWGTVAVGIVVISVAYRLILALVLAPLPPLGLTIMQAAATIVVYPLVVLVAHYIFGVRRVAPGEVGARGQRL
ncbi:MAG: rod shape-determining protein MreD [Pseudomonadota bacterium]